jgi:hypothetical protein
MSNPKKTTGMEHFTRLSPSIYLHDPTSKPSPSEPELILLCGWMDASMRNLAKYTSGYRARYPGSRIIVVTTSATDAVVRTNNANRKRVAPVLDIIYALQPGAKFLLHYFSNGGSWTTTMLAKAYKEKTGRPLPATAMILDSTPGRATYEATIRAFAVGLQRSNILIRILGTLVLRILFGLYKLIYWIRRTPDMIDIVREDLNDKSVFDTNTPRLYVYSEGDPMVDWRFVEDHQVEAQTVGYAVSKEKYVESGHCMHLLLDEKRYWGAVTKLWTSV